MSLGVAGCANPGPPKPPSLNLPTPIKDLRADRVGSEVRLTWTTPADSTDELPLKLPLSAEICRQLDPPRPPASAPCPIVASLPVKPGPSAATDPLPASLLTDPVHLLSYRVRLLNSSGKSADASTPAFAATGESPASVTSLHTAASPTGTRILWQPVTSPAATVLLDRTTIVTGPPPTAKHAAVSGPRVAPHSKSGPRPGSQSTIPAATRLQGSSAGPDPGGAIDTSAQRDSTYSYIAWRSRSVGIAGKSLTLRSPDSPPLTVTLHDTTPPATPAGLEVIVDGAAVDLSWEPDSDPDLVGYWVERATLPAPSAQPTPNAPSPTWQRLNPAPLVGPSFRDRPAGPGAFLYRVLAVDTTGNFSPPTPPVTVRVQTVSAP